MDTALHQYAGQLLANLFSPTPGRNGNLLSWLVAVVKRAHPGTTIDGIIGMANNAVSGLH